MDETAIKAYTAGLVDGEGTISISKSWILSVFIYNSSRQLLEYVQSYLGGTVTAIPREGKRTQCVLCWHGAAAKGLLELLQDYIILKSFKARMGMLYYKSFFEGQTHHRLSVDEKEARQVFRDIVSPNNKGRG